MHKAFKDPYSFFSAWEVYVLICTIYAPDRAPSFALFNERIYYMLQLNYSWYRILNYIVAFFCKYQDSVELGVWDDVDGTLIANHITLVQQKLSSSNDASFKSKSMRRHNEDIDISKQVCLNWNRKNVSCKRCQWRHVYSICENDDHRASLPCPARKWLSGSGLHTAPSLSNLQIVLLTANSLSTLENSRPVISPSLGEDGPDALLRSSYSQTLPTPDIVSQTFFCETAHAQMAISETMRNLGIVFPTPLCETTHAQIAIVSRYLAKDSSQLVVGQCIPLT